MVERTEPRPYRILIVEDQPSGYETIRSAISATVRRCEFAEARSVEEAECLLNEDPFPFDLAVIDLKSGRDENGKQVVRAIEMVRRRHFGTKVMVCSANPTVQSACAAYEAGASAYVPKLQTATEDLQRKARELLEQRKEREEAARQLEAQRIADDEFESHREEWIDKYGGRRLLFDAKKRQLIVDDNCSGNIGEQLDKYDHATRLDIAILDVPSRKEQHV